MCHPGLPPLPPGCKAKRRRAPPGAGAGSPPVPRREQPQAQHHYCVCSPTAHHGSFRCRWHRRSYEWGAARRRSVAP
ncbi:hypothetical protein E2562_016935 [Oryza meyeriana var. granulata]|uniref:Uncharacterized protein n=1 Tax=Oryza meyeriana var. granulata TaxID=110450 RepID=A0A6G1DYF1_9ORYZ|nr:hypothetical protein E2562_016935 [Oryza meyeriana var. granulata]